MEEKVDVIYMNVDGLISKRNQIILNLTEGQHIPFEKQERDKSR